MVANAGDAGDMEEGVGETRTVRMLESTRDDLSQEEVMMDVDGDRNQQDEERVRAMARGRGRGRGGKYMDN